MHRREAFKKDTEDFALWSNSYMHIGIRKKDVSSDRKAVMLSDSVTTAGSVFPGVGVAMLSARAPHTGTTKYDTQRHSAVQHNTTLYKVDSRYNNLYTSPNCYFILTTNLVA